MHKVTQFTKDSLSQISAIQGLINEFNSDITRVEELQTNALKVVEGSQNTAELDSQVSTTRDLGNQIKRRIELLKKQAVPRGQEARKNQARPHTPRSCHSVFGPTDCGARIEQVNVVAKQFMTALQNYTQVEKEHRQKQRQRVERQFKIGRS